VKGYCEHRVLSTSLIAALATGPYRCPSRQVDASKFVVCTDVESKRSLSWRVISHRFYGIYPRCL